MLTLGLDICYTLNMDDARLHELTELVFTDVERGDSLVKACATHGVNRTSLLNRMGRDSRLGDRYARAKSMGIDVMAEEIIALADAPVPQLPAGGVDGAAVRQRQLQIDSRKWILSKLAPKVYGDRLDVSVSDTRISISGALQAAQSRLIDVTDVTDVTKLHDDVTLLPSHVDAVTTSTVTRNYALLPPTNQDDENQNDD